MSTKGEKLREELEAATKTAPPWVVEYAAGGLAKEADAVAFVEAAFARDLTFHGGPAGTPPRDAIPKASIVVGAGKLERSKFDESLPKWITGALSKIGYAEDQSASSTWSSRGTYKFQHDTGQNLKFVHVFPRGDLSSEAAAREDESEAGGAGADEVDARTGAEKAEALCVESSLETFQRMVADKVGGWAPKKRLEKLLRGKEEQLVEIERKLACMTQLDAAEQRLFDATDRTVIEAKIAFLRQEMLKLVDAGQISNRERALVVEQFEARVAELERDKAPQAQLDKAKARLAAVRAGADFRHPLKEEARMKRLWERSIPLTAIQEKAGPKGRWSSKLTPDEVRLLGEKEEADEELERLARASRFWFEEEDDFEERVAQARKLVAVKFKGRASAGGAGAGAGAKSADAWSSVARRAPAAAAAARTYASAASKRPANAFGALADDDDSD